ncbi:uncharacterized protein LOC144826112 [Lissotriton helveticus]
MARGPSYPVVTSVFTLSVSEEQQLFPDEPGVGREASGNEYNNKNRYADYIKALEPCDVFSENPGLLCTKQNKTSQGELLTGNQERSFKDWETGARKSTTLTKLKQTHKVHKDYACSECGKKFKHFSSLHVHQRMHTGDKKHPGVYEYSSARSECGKVFGHIPHLITIPQMHLGGNHYPCSECAKSFSNSSSLLVHQRIHTGEKPYFCMDCDMSFKQLSQLIQHQRKHTDEKPYSCTECEKRFRQQSQLKQHQRIHTGEKPYQCTECWKRFRQQSHLIHHHRTHTLEKPYQCTECEKTFNRNSHLIVHTRKQHKVTAPQSIKIEFAP